MCGIVGYVGEGDGLPFLCQGLRRLEHRGYDSAGMALWYRRQLRRFREVGRVERLFSSLPAGLKTKMGIAHTRWATHGAVNQLNTHPHLSNDGRLAVVHNGIIDNYRELKTELERRGYTFQSESDSEVIPLLLHYYLAQDLKPQQAFQRCLGRLHGTFGLVVLDIQQPNCLMAARRGSPLLLAVAEHAVLIASEVTVFQGYGESWVAMGDDEIAILDGRRFSLFDFSLSPLARTLERVEFDDVDVERGSYPHFMLKEMEQQPQVLQNTMAGRLLPESGNTLLRCMEDLGAELFGVKRVVLVGCGTSYHAALVGARWIQQLSRIPCAVELASELSYSNPIVLPGDLYLALSQSGETADVLQAVRELQLRGARVLSLCNRVGSSLARLCGSGVYLHAGMEIAVASTKTFTAQMLVLLLVAIRLGRLRHLGVLEGQQLVAALRSLPEVLAQMLAQQPAIAALAREWKSAKGLMFIGRGMSYPLALEAALKLKEIAYLPSEGLAGGEIKHGPLALISPETPTFALLPNDGLYQKTLSNISEIRTRQGQVAVLSQEPVPGAEYHIAMPVAAPILAPFLQAAALQLFAYYFAVQLGHDVDHPRNLAKSVTVE